MIKKKLLLIGFLIMPLLASGQSLKQFGNGIFLNSQNAITETETVRISDFHYQNSLSDDSSIWDLPRSNPGVAFLSSALIPGSGQAANGKWVRAGIFLTAEVVGLIYHFDRRAKARRQEQAYEQFTHENWSVLAYADWLVKYSQHHNLNNGWQELQSQIDGLAPDYSNTQNDWGKVNIGLLHSVENQTPFYFKDRIGSNFSHELPNYGSQQYYELISKYYQFQSGWKDWYNTPATQTSPLYRYFWNGRDQPNALFYEGRDRAEEFNDNYRVAGNILKLLVLNHVVSAFDALFTVQLKNSRIETETNLLRAEQFSVIWHF